MNKLFYFLLTLTALTFIACNGGDDLVVDCTPSASFTTPIEESEQRIGNAAAGREFLIYGDYLSSGVPYDIYQQALGSGNANLLERTGDNADVRYDFSAVNATNGTRVVAPNCMQCHASKINDEFVMGLGNAGADFSSDQSGLLPLIDAFIFGEYGSPSPEWEAYQSFRLATAATAPYLVTEVRGANPADKLAAVLAAHRDKNTLEWNDTPAIEIPELLIPTDIPPWWVLKKKNAMFYSGIGTGDFCKFLMGSSLLTMENDSKAEELDDKFPDILAYLNTLEAPPYPQSVDNNLVADGEVIFKLNCSSCHGTYGDVPTYPELLVDLDYIGTDPLLVTGYEGEHYAYMIDWFNTGWFGLDDTPGMLKPKHGYVAQPLDGIWATAPYLHNGSVPTLEDLLNSEQRPTYWKRTFSNSDIDYDKMGWNYSVENSKVDDETYDTTLPGYGNQGHTFGDNLSDADRSALIEYLRTL